MTDKGESDLDVFKSVSRGPVNPPAASEADVAPPAPPPGSRLSAPPPRKPGASGPPVPTAEGRDEATATGAGALLSASLPGQEDGQNGEFGPLPDAVHGEEAEEATVALVGAAPQVSSAVEDYGDEEEATRVHDGVDEGSALQLLAGNGHAPAGGVPPALKSLKSSVPPGPAPLIAPPSRPSLPPPTQPRTSLPPPAAPPSLNSSAAPTEESGPVATDWDDEDDKTTIYTREDDGGGSGRPLFSSAPTHSPAGALGAPPPMSRPSAPVPTMPHQRTLTSLNRATGPAQPAGPASVPPGPGANRTPLIVAAVAIIALALGLLLVLKPSVGDLVVTVAGPGGQPLDAVEVLVDGKPRCKFSPCPAKDLKAGTHMVKARAAGYQETADIAVTVSGGQEAVSNIRLVRAAGTGVRVSGHGPGLKLIIDGKEVGPLPQELKDLEPGKHTLKVVSKHFSTWEKEVVVVANEMMTIGPLKLKVVKGLALIRAGEGAKGARVVLESGEERHSLPTLPIPLKISTDKRHTLIATRRGYTTYKQDIEFEDGEAEKTFEISLSADGSEAAPARARAPSRAAPRSAPRPRPASRSTAAGRAKLNINSLPPSRVILDGRSLGSTPKAGVSVSAGTHTVIFVKDGKRKSKTVRVAAGESKAVVHRFK